MSFIRVEMQNMASPIDIAPFICLYTSENKMSEDLTITLIWEEIVLTCESVEWKANIFGTEDSQNMRDYQRKYLWEYFSFKILPSKKRLLELTYMLQILNSDFC